MAAGIWAGIKCSWIPAESKIRGRFQYLFLFILLFVLGHQLGSDDAVVASISEMGFYGFVIATAAMVGSFLFVIALRTMFDRQKKAGRDD